MIKNWNILFLLSVMTTSVCFAETIEPQDLTGVQMDGVVETPISQHSLKRAEEVLVDVADRLRETSSTEKISEEIPSDLPSPQVRHAQVKKKFKDEPVIRPYREKQNSDALAFPSSSSSMSYDGEWKNTSSEQETAVPQKEIKMKLRELAILRRAAQMAGGDIKVSVKTLGITRDDLLVPLGKLGVFDLIANDDGSVSIESKNEDPMLEGLQDEVKKLEQRRRSLLADVRVLEGVTGITSPSVPQRTSWTPPNKTTLDEKITTPPIRWTSLPGGQPINNMVTNVSSNQFSSATTQPVTMPDLNESISSSTNTVVVLNPVVPKL
jgi:hypothetical protein